MGDFKVGDRVQVHESESGCSGYADMMGTVRQLDDIGHDVLVKLDGRVCESAWFWPEELRLVEAG
jgi:hypothetical protein